MPRPVAADVLWGGGCSAPGRSRRLRGKGHEEGRDGEADGPRKKKKSPDPEENEDDEEDYQQKHKELVG